MLRDYMTTSSPKTESKSPSYTRFCTNEGSFKETLLENEKSLTRKNVVSSKSSVLVETCGYRYCH
jgi:hypothetical protein